MLNSPSNPTGVVYSRAELEALADAVLETSAGVLSDEIYEQLCYGENTPTCFATLRPELARSDDHGFGGEQDLRDDGLADWLDGGAGGRSRSLSRTFRARKRATRARSASMRRSKRFEVRRIRCKRMHAAFTERREYVLGRVEKLPGVSCVAPGGAFYAFMNVKEHLGRTLAGEKVGDDTAFCLTALAKAHVAMVMGSAFGADGFARLSFATDLTTLSRGFDALEEFLAT